MAGVIHKLPQIIERDGGEWVCHYCGHKLVPHETPIGTEPYYQFSISRIAHPATCGDCNGYYSYEEVMYFVDLAIRGELVYWTCNWSLSPEYRRAQADHVIPRAKGGSDHLSNLVAACYQCNQAKRDKDYEVFVKSMARGGS